MNVELGIVVLNWFGSIDTAKCVRSITESSVECKYRILVVDNGSDQRSLSELRELLADHRLLLINKEDDQVELVQSCKKNDVLLIENGENLGFAGGNNVGIDFFRSVAVENLLLLNNDTAIEKGSIDKMYHSLQSSAVVVPQIRLLSDKRTVWNIGGDLRYFGSRRYNFAGLDGSKLRIPDEIAITFVTGCALMFKPQITGRLTERFFFGEEDFEFSIRAKRKKVRMVARTDAIIYHAVSKSMANHLNPLLSKVSLNYIQRFINLRENYAPLRFWVSALLYILYVPMMLKREHRTSFNTSFPLIVGALIKSLKLNSVDRDTFFKILNSHL